MARSFNETSLKGATVNEIGDQLRQEEEWLNTIGSSLEKSDHLKQNIIEILDSFTQRLSNLQSTVLPLYEHTGLLQQRQFNISKTLKVIDSTLAHYAAVSELDTILRHTEPGDDLDKYLKNMLKLNDAMKYFSAQNESGVQAENAKSTFEFGCSSLEREFKEILRKNSLVPKTELILSAVKDNYDIENEKLEQIDLLPVKETNTLGKIAQWLVVNGTSIDFTDFYAEQRSLQAQTYLKNVMDHLKSLTPLNMKSQASPLPIRRDGASFRPQGVTKKVSRQYASETMGRKTTLAAENVTKESSIENDAENFIILHACLLACVKMETDLCSRIFGQKELVSKMLRGVLAKPGALLVNVGNAFQSQVQRSLQNQDHASILCLMPVIKYLRANDRRCEVLYKVCSVDLKTRFVEFPKSIEALCIKGLEDFIEHVKTDEDKFAPKDGTVHQLTSNALVFLEQLMEWRDCLATVLSDGQPDQLQSSVPKLFARILSALGLNLRNKAELYNSMGLLPSCSSPLKALFMLNNYNHILKMLQKSGAIKIVCQQNREVENYYYDQVKEHKRHYLASWAALTLIVAEYQKKTDMSDGPVSVTTQNVKLKDKERDLIKSTFHDFNKAFESTMTFHATLSLPDSEMASHLRKDIKDLVLPKYNWFYNNHHTVSFSRNPEKYVRFTSRDIIGSIDRLFTR